jgi:hypothetical protein
MRITIEIERPLRNVLAVVAALALAIGAAGVVTASHLFADVPTSSSVHTPIAAIARAGITAGCGGGNFCPNAALTRGQEAALLHRGLSRVAMFSSDVDYNIGLNLTTLGSVTITVPGVSALGIGANQFVKVDAHLTTTDSCGTAIVTLDNDTDESTLFAEQADHGNTLVKRAVSTTYVFAAAPGTHTYYFRVDHIGDCVGSIQINNVLIVATTHTFGSTGHDVLGGS